MPIERSRAAELGRETAQILKDGHYRTAAGVVVDISTLLQNAVDGTRSYPPDAVLPEPSFAVGQTHIEVRNEATLATIRRLVEQGHRCAALNFASLA